MAVPFVGLTGGIGAGKSAALLELETLGAATLSSDAVVHTLYETDGVRDAVRERFGDEVFEGERVDRAALARRAFASEDDRAWLEQLIWPLVATAVEAFRTQVESRVPEPVAAVVETPLLFEAGTEGRWTATIAVVADDALRAERTAGLELAELQRREQRQLPQAEKARRADYVVVNDTTRAELRRQLAEVLAKLSG